MKTLQDAWEWYLAVRVQLRSMERLAGRHWDELPWEGRLGRDEHFRTLDRERVLEGTRQGGAPLPDLAVFVLFSLFETQIRRYVRQQVETEAGSLKHPALQHAANETLQQIDEGSFFRVLEPFKLTHPDLVEEVNQVRRYRNWVAHGRREQPPITLDPQGAFDRLERFLAVLGLAAGGGGTP
jgi:hypothetical protein